MNREILPLNIHSVKKETMTQLSVSTVYVCERCGRPVHVSVKMHPTIHMSNNVDFEATAKVSECDNCVCERSELIRDLWNALSWEKRQQFESPILDEIEQMIRGRQTVGYVGVTL